ncbi:RDD family protein [Hamadaea tsunoensis]|uniref:RDD family protein n=1 Tax=Hamadaea tsunoensis TaxID=53368 RepID=UPI00041A6E6C|nr:RDD family protein [Hamadaea tsunoensis]
MSTAGVTLRHSAYAGLVSRIGGLIVDALIAAVLVAVIAKGIPELWKLVAGELPGWVQTVLRYAADFAPLVYFAGAWRLTGETIGGYLFGTVVRRTDGRRIGVIRAVLRAFIGLLFAPVWLLAMVTVLWDERRRSLLDMAFGTVVTYAPRPGTPTPHKP